MLDYLSRQNKGGRVYQGLADNPPLMFEALIVESLLGSGHLTVDEPAGNKTGYGPRRFFSALVTGKPI